MFYDPNLKLDPVTDESPCGVESEECPRCGGLRPKLPRLIDFKDLGSSWGHSWLYTQIVGKPDGWNTVLMQSAETSAPLIRQLGFEPETILSNPGGLFGGQMYFEQLQLAETRYGVPHHLAMCKAIERLAADGVAVSLYLGYGNPVAGETPEEYVKRSLIPDAVSRIYIDSLAVKRADDFDYALYQALAERGAEVVAEGVPGWSERTQSVDADAALLWQDVPIIVADDDKHLPYFRNDLHRAEKIMFLHGGGAREKLASLRQWKRAGWSIAADIHGLGADAVRYAWESGK